MGRARQASTKSQAPALTEEQRDEARSSLEAYCAYTQPKWQPYRHTQVLIDHLQLVADGKLDRLVISLPPRHGKSLHSSMIFPAYYLARYPDRNVIAITYGGKFTRKFGRFVRNSFRDDRHRMVFPESDAQLAGDSMAVDDFALKGGGAYTAVGRMGQITGKGANLMILDDLVKNTQEARSEDTRQGILDNFSTAFYPRLETTPDGTPGAIVIVMTRWHEDDPAGHVLREHAEDGWVYVRMPALAEEPDAEYPKQSWDWRKPGEALWPERYPVAALERIRRTQNLINPADWFLLYQQRTNVAGGAEFKIKWLDDTPRYRTLVKSEFNTYIFVDPANSKKRRSDYTAMWALALGMDQNVYVLDMIRDRMTLAERTEALFRFWLKWKPIHACYYEQIALNSDVQHIQGEMERRNRRFSLIPVGDSREGKTERIRRLGPWFEGHRIVFPIELRGVTMGREVDLIKSFRSEYEVFPRGGDGHDDMLDALARFLDPKVFLTWPLSNEALNRRSIWGEDDADRDVSWLSA